MLVAISFLAGLTMDRLLVWLHRRRVPPFFSQALVAGLMTMIAAGVAQLGRLGWPAFENVDPTLIIVGGIVMLLAGVMIVGAVQDAIDQFYVTATARMLEVVMRTAGIVAGILVALDALDSWGSGSTSPTRRARRHRCGRSTPAPGSSRCRSRSTASPISAPSR